MATDFDRSLSFYTETLGLKLKYRAASEWAEIEAPGVSIGLHPAGGYAPVGGGGGMSLGLMVNDIEEAIRTLTARGVDFPQGWQPSGQLRLANFSDPDGTQLYLFQMVHG